MVNGGALRDLNNHIKKKNPFPSPHELFKILSLLPSLPTHRLHLSKKVEKTCNFI